MLIKRQVAHFPVVERYAVAIIDANVLFSPHNVSDHSFFVLAVDCAQDEPQYGYCIDRRHGLILRRLVHRDGDELDKVQVTADVVEAGEQEIVTGFIVVARAAG